MKKIKRRIRKAIRNIVRTTGYDFVRYDKHQRGDDPFADMIHFLKAQQSLTIFDVGANIGQSVDRFSESFPQASLHSFEPSPSAYAKLKTHCEGRTNVTTWNYGVGSSNTTMTFNENNYSHMSSFLLPSTTAWGKIVESTEVEIVTLDSFADANDIDFIHVLKSDTQGFDFEVFKGANQLMQENRIGLIYFEFIFSDMYQNLPPFDEVFRYLSDHNFTLVCFYDQSFQNGLVSWTDMLFINRRFHQNQSNQ